MKSKYEQYKTELEVLAHDYTCCVEKFRFIKEHVNREQGIAYLSLKAEVDNIVLRLEDLRQEIQDSIDESLTSWGDVDHICMEEFSDLEDYIWGTIGCLTVEGKVNG